MMKKMAAASVLTFAVGGFLLTAGPAMAATHADGNWPGPGFWHEPSNVEILPIQTCRGIDVAGIGAAIHNVLGLDNEEGPCVNGPVMVHGVG